MFFFLVDKKAVGKEDGSGKEDEIGKGDGRESEREKGEGERARRKRNGRIWKKRIRMKWRKKRKIESDIKGNGRREIETQRETE